MEATHRLTDADGYRLAGLVEGEGCFSVSKRANGRYVCAFDLGLAVHRQADIDRIAALPYLTGVGRVFRRAAGRSCGMTMWRVYTKDDCVALVDLFRRFEITNGKAEDFSIWSQAVALWASRRPGDSWEEIAALHDRLSASKPPRARRKAEA